MPSWTSKDEKAGSEEQDLSTLLSTDERADLTLLVANVTELMRKQVTEIFDASVTTKRNQQALTNVKNSNVNDSKPHEETNEEKEMRQIRERREKYLSEPKVMELKNEALKFVDEWRDSLVKRMGNVINKSQETAQEQVESAIAPDAAPGMETKVIQSSTNIEDADAALIELYPPTSTALYSLTREKRIVVLHAMLLLVLSLEHYVPHSRILLLHISSSLHLPLHILTEHETNVAQGLLEAAKTMSGNEETQKRADENTTARRWKVGLAGVAGAAVIGVTGGLAAPLVAGAIGTVMGGIGLGATSAAALLGGLAESGLIVGGLFGAYGGRMTGRMMDAYAKEVQDFAFLPLKGSPHPKLVKNVSAEDRRLRVTIGISGWLTDKSDVITPWRVLGKESEVFALRWELEALSKLGSSLESVIKSFAWSVAKKEIIARTVFASLMDAMWPIALLKVSKVIDNPFSVAKNRADKAGLVLADALINKAQGERPVTLIGYSLGARLIYSCLMSLVERRAFGLVESVVMMGAPAPADAADWRAMRSVVAGRLVNVYSEADYILAFLYRLSSIQYGVAGLQEVPDVKAIENVNVSKMVSGHLRYQYLVGSILEKIGFEDIDLKVVKEEEETLALMEEEQKEEEAKKKEGGQGEDPEKEAEKMEKEAKEKSDQTAKEWAMEKLHIGHGKAQT